MVIKACMCQSGNSEDVVKIHKVINVIIKLLEL